MNIYDIVNLVIIINYLMFIAGHAAAGALIGQQVGQNPLLIFILAFTSHLLMDLIPHGDRHHVVDYYHGGKKNLKRLYSELVIDSSIAIIITVVLMLQDGLNRHAMAWGIVGAVIPDLIVGLSEVTKSKLAKAFTKFHFVTHNALIHKFHISRINGTLWQVALIAGMLWAL